ncbi:MAG TPA: hypothetical protein VJZ71_14990 [Phycisphaerae bacterium]|nr:hypothetical protein [Phycisphaerae bacterium]
MALLIRLALALILPLALLALALALALALTLAASTVAIQIFLRSATTLLCRFRRHSVILVFLLCFAHKREMQHLKRRHRGVSLLVPFLLLDVRPFARGGCGPSADTPAAEIPIASTAVARSLAFVLHVFSTVRHRWYLLILFEAPYVLRQKKVSAHL